MLGSWEVIFSSKYHNISNISDRPAVSDFFSSDRLFGQWKRVINLFVLASDNRFVMFKKQQTRCAERMLVRRLVFCGLITEKFFTRDELCIALHTVRCAYHLWGCCRIKPKCSNCLLYAYFSSKQLLSFSFVVVLFSGWAYICWHFPGFHHNFIIKVIGLVCRDLEDCWSRTHAVPQLPATATSHLFFVDESGLCLI